jgi:hypothetical protein
MISGVAKAVSAFGTSEILKQSDPVFGMRYDNLFLTAGIIELLVAIYCAFGKDQAWSLILLAWISTGFLVYRFGLHWVGWQRPCPCLGTFTTALYISPELADNLLKGILTYILLGSYAAIFLHWRQRSTPVILA